MISNQSISTSAMTNGISSSNEPILYSDAQESFYIKLFLGIILLSLLGYNIFTYLKYGTDMFGNILIRETKSLVNTTKKTTKNIARDVKNTITASKNIVKDTIINENTLDKTLKYKNASKKQTRASTSYENKKVIAKKSGFCYIGEDRGYRTCVEVGENTNCESGKIFPTKQICINPNLRV
jgi:hypothetical protein